MKLSSYVLIIKFLVLFYKCLYYVYVKYEGWSITSRSGGIEGFFSAKVGLFRDSAYIPGFNPIGSLLNELSSIARTGLEDF
jgi:hypothetical protein